MGKATVASSVNGEFHVTLTESETTRNGRKLFLRKLGDHRGTCFVWDGSVGKGEMPQFQHVLPGKSDTLVVPEKWTNNAGTTTVAESVEERRLTKEEAELQKGHGR